jgi:hypothetical protein
MSRKIRYSWCKDLERRVNEKTNHTASIEEYPERPSDLTIDGKVYKRLSNTKIYEMLDQILNNECK